MDGRLKVLERELEELKSLYDQFFAGINRVMPQKEHDEWQKKFRNFPQAKLSSTSDKFRFRNLQAKHAQYNGMWQKIVRQIEEGRWTRDKFALKKHKPKAQPVSKPTLSEKERSLLKGLYQKIEKSKEASGKNPDQEKFMRSMEAKLVDFKKKHPNQAVNLKLTRDQKGQVQVQIKAGEKKSP